MRVYFDTLTSHHEHQDVESCHATFSCQSYDSCNPCTDDTAHSVTVFPCLKMVPSLLPLILLIAIRPSCVTSSNVTVVVDHCTSSDCYVSPVDQSTPQYHKSLVKLLSGGLPQVLWERISRSEHRNATVSTGCQDALSGIWSGMMSGDEMSYRCEYSLCEHLVHCY